MSKHGYATHLVGVDTKKQMPLLYPLSCGYWLPELELCRPLGERRCVIDTLVVLSPGKFENDLLELTQGLKKRNQSNEAKGEHSIAQMAIPRLEFSLYRGLVHTTTNPQHVHRPDRAIFVHDDD